MKTKICPHCKKEKDTSAFHKDKSSKDSLKNYCKDCTNEYNRKWRRNNPIQYWCRNTIKSHKYRGCEVLFKAEELFSIAVRINCCPICNTKLTYTKKRSQKNATLDRKDNGNVLTLDNTQIICHKCNSTKLNRTMKELSKWCKKFLDYYNCKN